MAAPSDIVRMQDIEAGNMIRFRINGKPCIGLLLKKQIACFFCKQFRLRERHAVLHDLIPDINRFFYISFRIRCNLYLHV